ncbi:heavy metal translocating P-type ATPase [Shewanella psychrotolerans]|uniref:heavy metal translocating P-type ATPase n=1 Tax=Shewanella psychrotolerans TaxID=2864206 RepID=UPI001C65914C|nr:heavy metal translocating P-type ATPase [Shewanella psychrotolerans]QYK02923.1 heavy metal translocating P-type ATPase [Shewanella psychrotolerans]
MDKLIFYVPTMNCASCVAKITKAMDTIKSQGDQSIETSVNLADKQVIVTGIDDAEVIAKVLNSAGYPGKQVIDQQLAITERQQNEHKEYRKRLLQSVAALGVGIPMMLWGLLGNEMMVNTSAQQMAWGAVGFITLLLMVFTGGHFYQGMYSALKAKSANMDTLIVLGTSAAWIYSMMVVVIPQWFPQETRHVYFEASVMILGLINLGHAMELRARGKTSEAVSKLIGLQPTSAVRVTEKGDETVDIKQISIGDKLRLKPGDRVALDGTVIAGDALINEAMLTGEPVPVNKNPGDSLSAGTVSENGSLVYRVTASHQETKLAKIIALVQQAQTSKLPIGRLTDQISAYFVPVVVIIAILASATWFFIGPAPQLSHALVVLTSVLIIACPCALGLATPMSIMVAVGRAAQIGVLLKNGEALQTASKITTVILDKTGTITEGKPAVTDVVNLSVDALGKQIDDNQLITLFASAQQRSEHPLASAILAYASEKELSLYEPEHFTNIKGQGISADIEGHAIVAGNQKLMTEKGIDGLDRVASQVSELAAKGKTPIYLAVDGQLAAIVAVADPIKSDAKAAISAMLTQGLKVVLLSGDNQHTAKAVASQVGINDVVAEVSPEQKQQLVLERKQAGEVVAMVGDGINDAPALAEANVGIAMGSGTEIAIESADITLLSERVMVLADTFTLAKAAMVNIKQNLFGAFIYNTLGIPVAAGVLFPITGWLLSPVVAGAAMALSSLTVVTNANRLRGVALSDSRATLIK